MIHKKIFVMIFFVIFTPQLHARALCALSKSSYGADQLPSPQANSQMSDANKVLCGRFPCPPYKFFRNPTAGNAQAYLDQTGGYIRYKPSFMLRVLKQFGAQATIGILSHELGHLIDFHTNPNPNISGFQREAKADEYAGCAFALAGAPPNALSALQNTLFSMGSSPGYPNTQQRVQLINSGYYKCRN